MPDISQYSPDSGFVPNIFSKATLSDVFIPSVEMPETSTPSGVNGFGGGDNYWSMLLRRTGRNPFAGLGIVPAGPAAVDDYQSNRKFTSEADSYQWGSTYKDIGFMIGRDNEDLFAKNRGFLGETFNAVTRLLDKAGAYTVQGFGFLGGLVGIGNKHDNYHSGSGFANWIAGASDNALAVWGKDFADKVDNIYRPIYNEAADRDKGFFKRMVSDAEFWTGDVSDGVSFLMSAYLTSGLGRILDLGGKATRAAAALRGLNFADEAAALSTEGLSGLSEATSLSGGATLTEAGAAIVPETFSASAGKVLSAVGETAGNVANARKINMGVSALLNTSSEALFESSNLKDELIDKLSTEKNADGSPKYSAEEIKGIAARAAKNSFLLNMLVLMPSNLWEVKMFYGKNKSLAGRNANNPLVKRQAGLLSNMEIAKRTFGQKGLDYLKNAGTGVVAEGLWEENIQLAIERINKDPENIDGNFFNNIGKVLNQYVAQTGAAIGGDDKEAASNIGIGGLIGGGMGIRSRVQDIKSVKRDVTNFNTQINAFKTSARDLYEKNDDGSIKLDENNQPVINPANVLSYISSLNKTLNTTELADNLKEKNMNVLHSIVDNENIARLVKAYADNGLVDDLLKKLDDSKGYKPEDLMLLGLSSNKDQASQRLDIIKEKAVEYKKIYDNIEKNFFVRMRNDNKNGSKARAMKDKLYYLSVRARHLADLKDTLDSDTQNTISDIAAKYPGENDSLIDQLNDLAGKVSAARKRADLLSNGQRQLTRGSKELPESDEEVIPFGNGNTITRKKKPKPVKFEEFTAVDEQDLSDAMANLTAAEKELFEFVDQNKEEIKNVKKNADGTFRYQNSERNKLTYDQGVVKNQNISRDLEQARNATLNVFNRLSDIKYGERYYDQKYLAAYRDQQQSIIDDDTSDQVDENLEDDPIVPPISPAPPGTKQIEAAPIGETDDAVEELNTLQKEKDIIESNENASLEDEVRLDEINKRIEELETALDERDESKADIRVDYSDNIPQEKKEAYKEVLAQIEKNKRKVIKRDGYYEINGERYNKVSDLIGNIVPDDLRPSLQNALAAGYTIDSVVKAYFDTGITEQVKSELATKISEDALNRLVKQLDAVRDSLRQKGIEIVATNVVTWDPALKVAGEIDILAVDKNGDFKVYEIEARQGRIWAQIATKTGRGPAIYDLTQKQLSAYRNLFANQYGVVPNGISVMFPIQVKYNKEDPSGFIEDVKLKKELRYPPTNNVQIKSKIFAPVRIGSKYNSIDLTSLFVNTFIPKALDTAKAKLRFLLRNESFENIKKGITITIKDAAEEFQQSFRNQQRALAGEEVAGYKVTPIPDSVNLYALKGNKEISIEYNGQLLGYMQPYPTLVYKGNDDKFHILDENTDLETYKRVTGNSEQTYNEFVNIAKSYKSAYGKLTEGLEEQSRVKKFLSPEDLKGYSPDTIMHFNQGVDNNRVTLIVDPAVKTKYSQESQAAKKLTGDSSGFKHILKDVAKAYRNAAEFDYIVDLRGIDLSGDFGDVLNRLKTDNTSKILSNSDVQEMFDVQMSYGELDLVGVGKERPDLSDLVLTGVKVGNKSVVTVVNINDQDAVHVMMDKNTRSKNTGKKYLEVDAWANANLEDLKKVMNNKNGEKVTDHVAIIETPDGKFHPLALRMKKDAALSEVENYVPGLGTKFTSSTSKNVFKNESVQLIPKTTPGEVNIPLKGDKIVSSIYSTEDVQDLEKMGFDMGAEVDNSTREEKVNSFVNELTPEQFKDINSTFAAYPLTKDELMQELIDEYNAGDFSSMDDYLENKMCDL